MPAHTLTSAGPLTVVFTRGGDAVDRRPAADGSDAVDVVIQMVRQAGELAAGDQLILLPADPLPAVSRASHYS